MSRYSVSPAKKIFGITFLSLVLVAATYVVTSGKFNMNPNKDAAMTCQGTCYRANLCDSLDRQTAVGSCSTGYVCCGAKIGGTSTPTPAPTNTPKPKTPTPTPCPLTGMKGGGVCKTSEQGHKVCSNKDSTIIKCDGRCWIIVENCAAQDKECKYYSSTPTCVSRPTEYSYSSYLITSGTCNDKCRSVSGFCEGVSTYTGEMNNRIMSWTDWSFCQKRVGNCGSTIKGLTSSGSATCGGHKPEWTYCHCKIPII